MTDVPDPRGPLVVALLYDGLCTFEFSIVAEIFGLARPEMGENWYRFKSVAIEAGPLRAHGGFTILPDHGPEGLEEADLIVVPGWKGADVAVPESLCAALQAAHARGARLMSICSGAFVLAATGLLAGGRVTTHWRYAEALQKRYPEIRVDAKALYHQEGRIATSAGSAAGIDLMLACVREDFGPEAANSVARRLVVAAHRSGGQAQFLERPVARHSVGAIAPLLDHLRSDLGRVWHNDDMARFCGLSLRSFLRRFAEATATTPAAWLVAERIEAAKGLLAAQEQSIEEIALSLGFGSGHGLRHHFRRALGLSPGEYRAGFFACQPGQSDLSALGKGR